MILRKREIACIAALTLSASVVQMARATTYTWDGGGGNVNWSTAGNWTDINSDTVDDAPVSASDTVLVFKGTTNVGTAGTPLNQDVATPFTLNRIEFRDGTAPSGPQVYLGGAQLHFVNDGATGPLIQGVNRSPGMQINNDILIDSGTTLTLKNSTYFIDFRGTISGDGAVKFDTTGGSGEVFFDHANTYAGGTSYVNTLTGTAATWRNFNINVTGALGTGDFNITGGNLLAYNATTNSQPGGVHFNNTSNTANTIHLLADSALMAGSDTGTTPTADNSVLSGTVDLNNFLGVLRGRGTGTITGTIDGSDGGRLKKISIGRWNLAGTMLFDISGSTASSIELDDGTLDISGLTLDLSGANPTLAQYVLVDYATGGTLIKGAGNPFAAVLNLPTGYAILDNVESSQILLVQVPTPSAAAAGSALLLLGLVRRRRA